MPTLELKDTLWQATGREIEKFSKGSAGYEATFTPDSWLILTGEDHPDFNMGLVSSPENYREHLNSILKKLRSAQLPGSILIPTSAGLNPEQISSTFGLELIEPEMPHMLYTPSDPLRLQNNLDITRVLDLPTLRQVFMLQAEAFEYPIEIVATSIGEDILKDSSVDIFLGKKEEEPASTVMTIQDDQDPTIGGIWYMATAGKHRRKGYGQSVLSYAINQGLNRGISRFHLHASEDGEPLYKKLGFKNIDTAAFFYTLKEDQTKA